MEFTQLTLSITISIIIVALLTASCLQSMRIIPDINYPVNEYVSISGARGLAAFFIYVNHAPFMLRNMGYTTTNFSSWGWIYGNLGSFGVQIFFCITGFLFFDRIIKRDGIIDWDRFYEARVRRIVPLFYSACVIYLLISLLSNESLHVNKNDMLTIAGLLTFGFIDSNMSISGFKLYPINAVIWTLIHEWRFYFALPLIAYAYRIKKHGRLILTAAVCIAAIDFKNSMVVCWAYFLTGIIVAIIANKKYSFNKSSIFILSTIALICFVVTAGVKIENGYNWQRFLLSSAFFVCIVLANPFYMHFKPIRFLGEISYSIYLLHLPILFVGIKILSLFTDIQKITTGQYWIFMLFIAFTIVIISSFSFRYIEYRFMRKHR